MATRKRVAVPHLPPAKAGGTPTCGRAPSKEKAMAVGSFCLVLHGHLPYVLRHGVWPHGEDWLYEAAAETYLPLLATIDECRFLNGNPRLTIGLTPILLEQLSQDYFKHGFERYLDDRIRRARSDHAEFKKTGQAHLAYLATRWEQFYTKLGEQFAGIGRDIPKAYAAQAASGAVQILTSAATHPYVPLLLEDASVRAQIRAGLASSERILGFRPRGLWLPESGYRPSGQWQPPIPWGGARIRPGLEHLVADEGITHFFVEHHLIEQSRSEWVNNGDGLWHKVTWDEAPNNPQRGWRSVHEPAYVNSDGTAVPRAAAMARDPEICEQVWSGACGYPANGTYLEFHKKHGERRGLRYWKITGTGIDLGRKDPYYPDDVQSRIYEHARHFCNQVKERLHEHRRRTGRPGVVTACFDAELFGHWWFEGPRFLKDVMLTLNADPDVDLATAEGYLKAHPPDKLVSLPAGSWGEGGDHRVWANDKTAWMWEVEYRCETIFGKLTFGLPWQKRRQLREVLQKAARELLLLQASDWPFVITRGQAIDYGIKRFTQHVARFECLTDIAEKLGSDSEYLGKLSEIEKFEVQDADIHDTVFPRVDLAWWNA
jgi:1,4-alpha-glucan branching enzyme